MPTSNPRNTQPVSLVDDTTRDKVNPGDSATQSVRVNVVAGGGGGDVNLTEIGGNPVDTDAGAAGAGTLRVVLATDQPVVPVSGPLTDAELRATPVPVSGPLTDVQLRATPVPVSGPLTDAELRATPVPVSGPLTDAELRATPVPVSGPLTDVQLRATPVPVSGPLTDVQLRATAVPVSGPLTDAQLRATPVPVSGTVAVTGPLTDAQLRATPVPVSGTVAVTGPLTDAQLRATPVPVSGTVAVTGPLTDAELRATPVPVSGPLTDVQLRATPVPVSGTVAVTGPLTDAQLRATPVPVSGTVAVTGPLTDAQLRATAVPVTTGLATGAGAVDATVLRTTSASDDPVVTKLDVLDDWDNAASDGASVSGDVANDAADAGEPVKIGGKALVFGTNPPAVDANDRTNFYATRQGIPFVLVGTPNVIPIEFEFTTAQTDFALIPVSAGTKIVVLKASAMVDADCTVNVAVRIGFAAATLPAVSTSGAVGIVLSHPDIAAGGGLVESTVPLAGTDGQDLRITCDAATNGRLRILICYFTIVES